MKRKGNHSYYELAVENRLRHKKMNYIATNEFKKGFDKLGQSIKNFDFLLTSNSTGTKIVDVKGKRFGYETAPSNIFENWIYEEDITSMLKWEEILSENGLITKAVFWFVYELTGLSKREDFFSFAFKYKNKKYAIVEISASTYKKHSKVRSKSIKSINVSRRKFEHLVTQINI